MRSGDRDCNIRRQDSYAIPLKEADAIIWDEVSMVPKFSLEAVDLLLQDLMCNNAPFGDGDLIDKVFGDQLTNADSLSERAILAPRNLDIHRINEEALNKMPRQPQFYRSIDEVVSDEQSDSEYSTEFLNSLAPTGLPPHTLRLKKDAIVMLLRNLDVRGGIDNYTDKGVPFRLRRRQFPIRLAFAMTINKAQGQSLNSVGIYLGVDVFSHGQLYVALSRARRMERVKVDKSTERVRNIVMKAVLS
ncbi:hypothetical protein ANCCAN_08921 [Ancylostoma caninum]|uniref:ATP-dependent DNA helicase n=1 Tax=Ancylostoma caninum TaxID=29170 RepID=A0A368GL15_ANCCA|nr:hypothetical protein ANCCAN_08921 [Ancylostoma caninum]